MSRTHWHLCISAPPPDLALPLLMFGFEQMASAEVEHRQPESRTQAGAELPLPASVQQQPVIQTFSKQTFSILCSWFCQQGRDGKTDSQRVTLRLTLSRCLLPSSSTCCSMQHAARSHASRAHSRLSAHEYLIHGGCYHHKLTSMRLFRRDLTGMGTEWHSSYFSRNTE